MKKGTLLLAMVALCAVIAFAASPLFASAEFDVDNSPITDSIYPNESATFEVTINNYEPYDDRYVVYTLDPHWNVEPTSIAAKADRTSTTTLSLRPLEGTNAGAYQIPISFRSTYGAEKGNTVSRNFFLFLRSPYLSPAEYIPDVSMDVSFPENIDPRNRLPVEIKMKNRNTREFTNLTLTIESDLFKETASVDLKGFEEKTLEFWMELDPLQQPSKFKMSILLETGEEDTITNVIKNFAILGYSTIQLQKEKNQGIFRTVELITLTNEGNYEKTQTVKLQLPFFQRLFTSTEPDYTLKRENGISSLTWEVSLAPDESTSITMTTNYRGLVAVIVLAILGTIFYFVYRSPIISLKRARLFDGSFEKATHMKVKLFIKNRTSKPVFNIKIIDKLPHIAEFIEEDSLGTLKPVKVFREERHGTIVRWEMEKLDPYEERIITYKAKCILNIVGNIRLPGFKTKFEASLGRERVISSNSVELVNESAPADIPAQAHQGHDGKR